MQIVAVEANEGGLCCQALMQDISTLGHVSDREADPATPKFVGKGLESRPVLEPAFVPEFDLKRK
jgi:hypothetical protein